MIQVYSNKGQQIPDMILLFLIMFGIFISVLVLNLFTDELENIVDTDPTINSSAAQFQVDSLQVFNGGMDPLFVFILLGIGIAGFVSVSLLRSNPILFIPAILLIIPFIMIIAQFSNVVDDIEHDNDDLATISRDEFPISNFAWDIMPLIITIFLAVGFIVFYGKKDNGVGV